MKRILLAFFSILGVTSLPAQIIFSEDFTGSTDNSLPLNWLLSNNTDVHTYQRPFAYCDADKGLQTPAVGKNAPSRLILPELTYDAANGDISISLKVYIMDANLHCNGVQASFPCPTYVRVMLIKTSYAGGTNALPPATFIYAERSYLLRNANGNNTIIFHHPDIPNGASYRIYFDFKTAESTNCSSSGIKFVLDDFVVRKSTCTDDCPPVANDDYFDGNRQGYLNVLRANVYGGFLPWASVTREGFERQSLSISTAIGNGLDFDVNNHSLASMQFVLVSDPTVVNSQCSLAGDAGILNWYGDGSFQYTRTNVCIHRISFQYKIIDSTGLESNTATVTMDFVVNSPLPVSFYSFTAQRDRVTVTLKWQTVSEKNCKGFYVQSNTGSGWTDRGFVFSFPDGNSDSVHDYEFHENNSSIGITQYRLAEQDMDGFLKYSKIIIVPGTEQSGKVSVYPNPSTNGSVTIVFPQTGVYSIELIDAAGRKIKDWKKVNIETYGINRLRPGVYILRIKDMVNGRDFSAKFIVVSSLNYSINQTQ